MKILVTGATGLVGTALVAALAREGQTVCRLVRSGTKSTGGAAGTFDVPWDPETGSLGGAAVRRGAVGNFGGAPIAGGLRKDIIKKTFRPRRPPATPPPVAGTGTNKSYT